MSVMRRSFEFKVNIDTDYSNIPEICAYCNGVTNNKNSMLLPNREYVMSAWHRKCVNRFIVDCMKADNTI
jgi:hypothetical protein